MRSDELIDVRADIAEWSEPIISDYLHDAYVTRLGPDTKVLRMLVASHGRFWRMLLAAQDITTSRRELVALARLAGQAPAIVDAIDVGVLDELMNVTLARFLRSPSAARDYSHYMLRIATYLSRAHTTID